MTYDIDIAIIGAGPGGYTAAIRAAQLGKKVAVIEKEHYLGGVCLNYGCIPVKALVHASSMYNTIKGLSKMGIDATSVNLDYTKTKIWTESIVKTLNSGIASLFKKHSIRHIQGFASFIDKNTLLITDNAEIEKLSFKNAIIATGSEPIEIKNFPFSHPKILSSRDLLDLHELPKRICIIGAGYIGTELGIVLGKLGVKVSLVEAQDHIIPSMDQDLADIVYSQLESYNITTYLSAKAVGFKDDQDDNLLHTLINVKGKDTLIDSEAILVVTGTKPYTLDLELATVGIRTTEKGFIKVDKHLRTDCTNIYAVGDVIGQPMLAHKASREGIIVAESISGNTSPFNNRVVPCVAYTDPEIASVGLSESEAKKKRIPIRVGRFPLSALGRAHTLGNTKGFVKVITEKSSRKLLGVHGVGIDISSIISEAALAIEQGLTSDDIAKTIHPHPTISESIMEAADAVIGRSINSVQDSKKKFSPRNQQNRLKTKDSQKGK